MAQPIVDTRLSPLPVPSPPVLFDDSGKRCAERGMAVVDRRLVAIDSSLGVRPDYRQPGRARGYLHDGPPS